MRRCSTCKLEKSPDAFFANKAEKDGISRHCAECSSLYREVAEDGLSKQNRFQRWGDWDLEILTLPISIRRMAEMTGRSYAAVCVKRSQLKKAGELT